MDRAPAVPARRTDLVIRPLGEGGQYVVKNAQSGEFFHLGAQEHFLFTQLDGEKDSATVCRAFGERFGEPLFEEDLRASLEMARERGLLEIRRAATQRESGFAVSKAAKPSDLA